MPGNMLRMAEIGTMRVKSGLAEMLKGGVIMDVVNADQAKIAEEAGACAVMALERVPADIRVQGGVARMSDPDMIKGIQEAVSIPVMAKCRIGHFVEAVATARLPWFAIGGIDLTNVAKVREAGATRLAVVRAIRDAADPEAAARAFRDALPA